MCRLGKGLSLTKRQILDSSYSEQVTDNKFKFDENGGKFSERVENAMGKEEIARRAINPFPTAFSKEL